MQFTYVLAIIFFYEILKLLGDESRGFRDRIPLLEFRESPGGAGDTPWNLKHFNIGQGQSLSGAKPPH